MSYFKLPKGLIKDIEVMIRKFWWGYSSDTRKIHWVKWEKLCSPKEDGGLWFKEIEKVNEALLAKQVWHMMKNPESLCLKVFKARFFPNCSILEANESKAGSYAWKSILSAREVVKNGTVWRIGDGNSVGIREDKWLPDQCYRKVTSPLPSIPPDSKVSYLIDTNTREWKVDLIKQAFVPQEAEKILSIPLSIRLPPDQLIWSINPSDKFTTRSAYRLLASNALANNPSSSNSGPQKSFWRGLWKLRVLAKVKHFAWRACNEALPTMVNLACRQVVNLELCSNCNSVPEDVVHAVWSWKAVEGVWQTLSWKNPLVHAQQGNFSNLFASFLQVTEDYGAEIFILAAWSLWNRRNAVRLNHPTHPLDQTLSVARGLLQEYINAQPNLPTPDQLPTTH